MSDVADALRPFTFRSAPALADALAQRARARAEDPNFLSPFAVRAQAQGWGAGFRGGKLDDITVVVVLALPMDEDSDVSATTPVPSARAHR